MGWKGFETTFGIQKATTWGTPVQAYNRVLILSEGLAPDVQDAENNSLIGSPFQAAPDKGMELHAGDVQMVADYQTIHRMLAFAMGLAGNPVQQGATAAYKHTLRMKASLNGIFATLVLGPGAGDQFIREYTTSKFNGFSGSCDKGGLLQMTFPQLPHGLNINTSSGTNSNTTIDEVVLPTDGGVYFATFNELEVLVNDASGAALASSDEVYLSSFSFAADGAMPADDVTTKYAPKIDEPERDGFVTVTGTLSFSKLESSARIADLLAKTKKKMTATWASDTIESPYKYTVKMYFSDVIFQSGSGFNVTGPGRVPETINFKAHTPVAAHTGFPQAEALVIEVTNKITADPLA